MTPVIFDRPERRRYRPAVRTLVLVEDPDRLGLCTRMIGEAGGVSVVGDPDGDALSRHCRQIRPDVIVIGESESVEAADRLVRKIITLHSDAKILVIGDHACIFRVRSVQGLGALGYLSWKSVPSFLIEGIRIVARGTRFVGPDVKRVLIRPVPPRAAEGLTAEEIEVLRLLADGLPVRLVSVALGLPTRVVGRIQTSLRYKLGAETTIQAVKEALRRGYLSQGSDSTTIGAATSRGAMPLQVPEQPAGAARRGDRSTAYGHVGPAPEDQMT